MMMLRDFKVSREITSERRVFAYFSGEKLNVEATVFTNLFRKPKHKPQQLQNLTCGMRYSR